MASKNPNESNFIPWEAYLDYRSIIISFAEQLGFCFGVSKRKFQEVPRNDDNGKSYA